MNKKVVVLAGAIILLLIFAGSSVFFLSRKSSTGSTSSTDTTSEDARTFDPKRVQTPMAVAKEINAPRGEFVSVSNNVVTIKEDSGSLKTIPIKEENTNFSCVLDNLIGPNGVPVSLYSSYINLDQFTLRTWAKLFDGEQFFTLIDVPRYEGAKVIYVTKDSGAISNFIEAKFVFMGCKT